MNHHRVGIETEHGTGGGINTDAHNPAGHDVSSDHGCTSGGRCFAFHSYRLRDVTGLAYRDIETFSPASDELRRRHAALAGRKLNGRPRRLALHIEFIVHAACDRRAGNAQERQNQTPDFVHGGRTLLGRLSIGHKNPAAAPSLARNRGFLPHQMRSLDEENAIN